jgi:hypothetical protein
LFKANPEKYAPQYGGYCAYGVAKDNLVSVEPDQFKVIDGKLYLNYDAGVQATWSKDPASYIREADRKFEAELRHVHEVYLDAWEDNWGFVKMTDREFHKMAEGIKDMIDPHYCYMAFINGEIAAFSITLPDYNQVVKPMNGRIFPFGWWHYLTRRSKVDQMRVFTLGVKKKFRHMNLGLPLYKRTWEAGLARKVKGAEASWILESNRQMRDPLEKMGFRIYKTYRIFERPVDAATRP